MLRYGIPDFKLDKGVFDRRLEQMRAEGVQFEPGVKVGEDISMRYMRRMFDAIVLTMGAGQPRDLPAPGRDYEGVCFAWDYLVQQNKLNSGELRDVDQRLMARDKVVVVIGGGDTGSDCVGTARRQGAKEIHQFEILPKPPEQRPADTPWPLWPRVLRTSTSQEEGVQRRWCVLTKKLSGVEVRVTSLQGVEVEWYANEKGAWKMREVPGTEFEMPVDLVVLAMGFLHVAPEGLVEHLRLGRDERGNLVTDENGMTSEAGVFAAGDAVSGASLVVTAIWNGRQVAAGVDRWLAANAKKASS